MQETREKLNYLKSVDLKVFYFVELKLNPLFNLHLKLHPELWTSICSKRHGYPRLLALPT
jgi:hypothetical protein